MVEELNATPVVARRELEKQRTPAGSSGAVAGM